MDIYTGQLDRSAIEVPVTRNLFSFVKVGRLTVIKSLVLEKPAFWSRYPIYILLKVFPKELLLIIYFYPLIKVLLTKLLKNYTPEISTLGILHWSYPSKSFSRGLLLTIRVADFALLASWSPKFRRVFGLDSDQVRKHVALPNWNNSE